MAPGRVARFGTPAGTIVSGPRADLRQWEGVLGLGMNSQELVLGDRLLCRKSLGW